MKKNITPKLLVFIFTGILLFILANLTVKLINSIGQRESLFQTTQQLKKEIQAIKYYQEKEKSKSLTSELVKAYDQKHGVNLLSSIFPTISFGMIQQIQEKQPTVGNLQALIQDKERQLEQVEPKNCWSLFWSFLMWLVAVIFQQIVSVEIYPCLRRKIITFSNFQK